MIMLIKSLRKHRSLLILLLVLAVFSSGGSDSVAAADFAQRGKTQKLIVDKDVRLPDLPGLALWHDYGSFQLYRVSASALLEISALGFEHLLVADEIDQILLDASPFDTQAGILNIPEFLSLKQPLGPALILIQFVGPIKAEWLVSIREAGGIPIHYIANNAYLVWGDKGVRSRLAALVSNGDFLQYSAIYQPYFKLSANLTARVYAQQDDSELVKVAIQMYRHPDSSTSEGVIEGMIVEQLSGWEPVMEFQTLLAMVRIVDLPVFARLPDVFWIGERFERGLLDEVQGQVLAGNLGTGNTGPVGPGYLTWLASLGFSQNPNDYPIVDVTDDGIGNGSVFSGDNTLHILGNSGNATRLGFVQNCTAAIDGGGPDGHGHINASIVGGYDARSGSPYQDVDGFNLGLGVNPYGRLGGTRIFTEVYDISACGGTDAGVIRTSYNAGARISSNSWGCSECASIYDESSQAYDVGTRDALQNQPGNQQFTFVFAAGNNGPGSNTVGSPGNAKNVITVGASENDRPTWTDGCGVGPNEANNVMDVVGFSSRGPAPGNRVKPELVAPGTHIQGTASTNENYNGSSVCDRYQPTNQQIFAASSGTSHSTPAVAGITALYSYWLKKNYGLVEPSPAVLKAYLLAHPSYLTGVSANDDLPSNNQGYGMPNMSLGFDNTSRYILDQAVVLDDSGGTWTFQGGVNDPTRPVRIVMAYTDQAGAVGTSPQVNDLNLKVQLGNATYLGNHFLGRWSSSGGVPDTRNNYEAVFLPAGTNGNLKITITGFNIAGDGVPNSGDSTDQDFALVCYNCAQSPDFTISATPMSRQVCTSIENSVSYDVSVGSILGFSSSVTLSASGNPQGTSLSFTNNPLNPPGDAVLTVTGLQSAAEGDSTIEISGRAGNLTHTSTVGLEVFGLPPAAPVPISPSDGAVNVPLQPTFDWSIPNQSLTYTLEIATDIDFNTIVYSMSGISKTPFNPGIDLLSNTLYFWRVRAENACGVGGNSVTFKFTTYTLPGDCPVGYTPVSIYYWGFESGAAGWTHNSSVGQDTWQISAGRSHTGLYTFQADALAAVTDQRLVSPLFQLPLGVESLILDFWNYQSIEMGSSGDVCYDGGLLEISTDGGGSWNQVSESLLLTDPYDAPVAALFSNPLSGMPAWCGDPQDWTESIVALNDYAGQSVKFRFRLGTDNSIPREGWYIDDVSIEGCRLDGTGGVQVGPDQEGIGRPGEAVNYSFNITNTSTYADAFLLATSGVWETALSTSNTGTLQPGEVFKVKLTVNVPATVDDSLEEVTVLRVTSNQDSSVFSQAEARTLALWWRNYLSLVN